MLKIDLKRGTILSCICQQCGKNYRVDLNIPDNIWEKIKPANKPVGAGLLCGVCIMKKIEDFGKYGVINVGDDVFELSV